MRRHVFFSWQTDTTPKIGHDLIRDSLAAALQHLRHPVELDEATRDVPGMPDIVGNIFSKIERCAVFVADLTLFKLDTKKEKFTANPNVLIEYGYALAKKEDHRIIPVLNQNFGPVERLPFDLRHKAVRAIYDLAEDADEATIEKEKARLTDQLVIQLRLILEDPKSALSLSSDELAVAEYLVKNSDDARSLKTRDQEEIAEALGIDFAVAVRAIAGLASRAYVERLSVLGTDTPPVEPTYALLWALDPFVHGWNAKDDAKAIAQALVESSQTGHGRLSTLKFRERADWPLRRLNPALRYLMAYSLVRHSETNVPDVMTRELLEDDLTRGFVEGRFDPDSRLRG